MARLNFKTGLFLMATAFPHTNLDPISTSQAEVLIDRMTSDTASVRAAASRNFQDLIARHGQSAIHDEVIIYTGRRIAAIANRRSAYESRTKGSSLLYALDLLDTHRVLEIAFNSNLNQITHFSLISYASNENQSVAAEFLNRALASVDAHDRFLAMYGLTITTRIALTPEQKTIILHELVSEFSENRIMALNLIERIVIDQVVARALIARLSDTDGDVRDYALQKISERSEATGFFLGIGRTVLPFLRNPELSSLALNILISIRATETIADLNNMKESLCRGDAACADDINRTIEAIISGHQIRIGSGAGSFG